MYTVLVHVLPSRVRREPIDHALDGGLVVRIGVASALRLGRWRWRRRSEALGHRYDGRRPDRALMNAADGRRPQADGSQRYQ